MKKNKEQEKMEDPVNQFLFQLINGRMNARGISGATPEVQQEQAPAPVATPAAAPTPTPAASSAAERSKGIMSIITETYNIPNANAEERRLWAKRRIADEYGEDVARKYMRTREGKAVGGEEAPALGGPTAATPAASTPPATPALTTPPGPAPAPTASVLAIDSELRKIVPPAQQ